MRNFRHLSKVEISEIIELFVGGETKAAIAERFSIDRSTVNYHVREYERSYPEDRSVYAVLKEKARKACAHPSGRCTLCGQMWDELRRIERQQVAELRAHLGDALSRLKVAGIDVKSLPYNGVNETR